MEIFSQLQLWAAQHQHFLAWLGGLSAVMFVGSLLAVPFLLCKIPADYFVAQARATAPPNHHILTRGLLSVLKNLLGFLFLLTGIAMLVLPGQGLLTILLGLLLMDFPGKQQLEVALISKPSIHQVVNWIREKKGVAAIKLPSAHD